MLFGDGVVGLALLVLWIFCILDVISTEEVLCRNLPKYVWLLIVIKIIVLILLIWIIVIEWRRVKPNPRG